MRGWLIALGVLALMVVGFLFVRGPSPVIIVAPEHIFDIGPLEVTNTMFTSWFVVALICAVAIIAGRNMSVVPSGFSGAVEALVSGFYGIVVSVAGEQNGRRFFGLVATIFFYVLVSNYFGLLPFNMVLGKPEAGHGEKQVYFRETSLLGLDVAYIPVGPDECEGAECTHGAETAAPAPGAGAAVSAPPGAAPGGTALVAAEEGETPSGTSGLLAPWFRSVNTDVNAPMAIAIFSFLFVEFWGLQSLGPGYLKKFFNFGGLLRGKPMGLIDVFVGFLELLSELSRVVSFTFRLFGNIFAGEVLLTMMTFLVPFVLVDIFFGLELFVGLVQAFVFAMLTLVFAQTAVAMHGGGEHEAAGEGHH